MSAETLNYFQLQPRGHAKPVWGLHPTGDAFRPRARLRVAILTGAWKEVSDLVPDGPPLWRRSPLVEAFTSNYVEKQALELAMVWAADKKRTAAPFRAGDLS